MQQAFLKAIEDHNITALKDLLRREPTWALSNRITVAAAQGGFKKGLMALTYAGANLNGLYRGYRPLHALIQEKPHASRASSHKRMVCLRWMLNNGADPEQLGAWPAARAILIAAFVGEPSYVDTLLAAGAKVDGFVHAALGNVAGVKKAMAAEPGFANSRDHEMLTPLQCAANSRMGAKDLLKIATMLVDAGADVNASTKGWSHDLHTAYFAVNSGNRDIFAMLLGRGMNATAALTPTAWKDYEDWCELAISHGARINEALDDGKPLLNQMIRWGRVKAAMWLLAKGADANIADERGWTAVHQATSRGNLQMLQAVMDAGGDAKREDKDGVRPYLLAKRKELRDLLA